MIDAIPVDLAPWDASYMLIWVFVVGGLLVVGGTLMLIATWIEKFNKDVNRPVAGWFTGIFAVFGTILLFLSPLALIFGLGLESQRAADRWDNEVRIAALEAHGFDNVDLSGGERGMNWTARDADGDFVEGTFAKVGDTKWVILVGLENF